MFLPLMNLKHVSDVSVRMKYFSVMCLVMFYTYSLNHIEFLHKTQYKMIKLVQELFKTQRYDQNMFEDI